MVCAKQIVIFDQVKIILPMIFISLGCTLVTLKSVRLLYINTFYHHTCLISKLRANIVGSV